MKSSVLSTAATLFFAAIACAAPLSVRDSSVVITIKTGDGDSATTISVPLDQITATSGQSSQAVAASISDSGVFCQAFSDSTATRAIGSVFSAGNDASYSASSNGGTASVASDAVTIGSFLCSKSQAGVTPVAATSSSSSITITTSATTATSTSTSAVSASSVLVLLEQISDQFVQSELPIGTLVATDRTILGNKGLDLSLVNASGANLNQVSCQAFSDAAGKSAVGNAATSTGDALLSADRNTPATLGAIFCSLSS